MSDDIEVMTSRANGRDVHVYRTDWYGDCQPVSSRFGKDYVLLQVRVHSVAELLSGTRPGDSPPWRRVVKKGTWDAVPRLATDPCTRAGAKLSAPTATGIIGAAQGVNGDAEGPNQIFFPWVPDGAVIEDSRAIFDPAGPFGGSVTTQNLETEQIRIYYRITSGGGLDDIGTYDSHLLDGLASTTLTAAHLRVADEAATGAGVVVAGYFEPDPEGEQTLVPARIAGVQKQASPVDPTSDELTDASTDTGHEIVDGYTGLTTNQVSSNVVLPIVQTNNNWNTVIRVTNFGPDDSDVVLTLYPAGGTGERHTLGLIDVAEGETVSIDLLEAGIAEEWVGSATIAASGSSEVGAVAERIKHQTSMLIMTVSQPVDNGTDHFAPLVFNEWNFWNTGISIANFTAQQNDLTVSFFGPDGEDAGMELVSVPAYGMNYIYTPAPLNPARATSEFVGSAIIEATGAIRAVVDEVKYFGDNPDTGHAMSYSVVHQTATLGESLVLPLVQKGDKGLADTTGIQLFNPTDESVTAAVRFFDQTGDETLGGPMIVTLEPKDGETIYAFDIEALQAGFQGSAIVQVYAGEGAVTAVSNNVNYEVQFDGSTSFNMVHTGIVGPATPELILAVVPRTATNPVGEDHTITVTLLNLSGVPVMGDDIMIATSHSASV